MAPAPRTTLADRLRRCRSWPTVIEAVFGRRDWDVSRRITDAPADVFQDPVTARRYDALYDGPRAAFGQGLVEEIRPLLRDLPAGSLIVEPGTGPGRLLLGLAADPEIRGRGHRFVGWDPSAAMVALAEAHRRESAARDRIRFLAGTSTDIEVRSAARGAVFLVCRNVLAWVDDTEAECRRWRDCLAPEARLYVREIRRDVPFARFKARLLDATRPAGGTDQPTYPPTAFVAAFLRAFTPGELRAVLETGGFAVEELVPQAALGVDEGQTARVEMAFRCAVRPPADTGR